MPPAPLRPSTAANRAPTTAKHTQLSKEQKSSLEQLYRHTAKPSRHDRETLAGELNLSTQVVTSWFKSRQKTKTTSRTRPPSSRRPSLDVVASRSELPLPPRTPRHHKFNPHAPLWAHMLSSPPGPASSPHGHSTSYGKGSLEWACARRRRVPGNEDEENLPGLLEDVAGDTDVDSEIQTPPSSNSSQRSGDKSAMLQEPDEEMMKAALALCGLMHG
ncbi:hypothetical protein FB45DRAFT_917248 [Roridomyces roridus]|uniref:Homeobox domain-containing protein n=1 Tax=Roridomyces roridus TaxID=1738132 RepID=A0AAD7FPJ3_9AGAR|nr:hypothetical protein FB45DRAFT_917248 [Roridomyces roridus]